MSKDAVVQMLSQVDAEPGLRDEFTAALEATEGKAEAIMAVAEKHGYDFTPEEFRDVVSEAKASEGKSELSEEDLNQVAGGIIDTNTLQTNTLQSFTAPTISLAYSINSTLVPGGTLSMEGPGRP